MHPRRRSREESARTNANLGAKYPWWSLTSDLYLAPASSCMETRDPSTPPLTCADAVVLLVPPLDLDAGILDCPNAQTKAPWRQLDALSCAALRELAPNLERRRRSIRCDLVSQPKNGGNERLPERLSEATQAGRLKLGRGVRLKEGDSRLISGIRAPAGKAGQNEFAMMETRRQSQPEPCARPVGRERERGQPQERRVGVYGAYEGAITGPCR